MYSLTLFFSLLEIMLPRVFNSDDIAIFDKSRLIFLSVPRHSRTSQQSNNHSRLAPRRPPKPVFTRWPCLWLTVGKAHAPHNDVDKATTCALSPAIWRSDYACANTASVAIVGAGRILAVGKWTECIAVHQQNAWWLSADMTLEFEYPWEHF